MALCCNVELLEVRPGFVLGWFWHIFYLIAEEKIVKVADQATIQYVAAAY
jgi:hypothetical protein